MAHKPPQDVQAAAEALTRKTLKRLLPLFTDLQTHIAAAQAVATDIQNIIGDGDELGAVFRDLETTWASSWERIYRSPYHWRPERDRKLMRTLLRELGKAELLARMARAFRDRGWLATRKHDFGCFASTVNHYAQANGGELELVGTPAIDCRHQPPCRDDATHSAKMRSERRGA